MYHLLKGNRKLQVDQGVSYALKANREPLTEPGATHQEPLAQLGATSTGAAMNQEPLTEPEPVYTVIGEPVLPGTETDPTTIVLDLHPVSYDDQHNEEPEPEEDLWDTFPLLRRRFAPMGWTLVGVTLVLVGVLVVTLVIPWFETSATITIIPVTRPVSTTITAHLVPGTADLARQQVQGRQLATLTLSREKTVVTTGSGSQPAQAAHGWITLYNALPNPQTIPAGTLIIGRDNAQVTTDTTVTIPSANLPTDGQVSVSAHATEPGPAGNIAAQDINGPCCRADVLARNAAPFTGGQNARSYPAVSAQDIQSAATALQIMLTQDVTAAYQAELGDGESLMTPISCTSQIHSDHPARVEAEHVTVTLSETCQGIAYNSEQIQTLVTQAMNQQIQESQVGAYHLGSASLHIQVTPSGMHAGDVQVQVRGTLVYQWSQQQLDAFAALIAGKSKAQSTALLLQQPGISRVAINLTGRDTSTLPSDSARIHFLLVITNQQGASNV